MLQAKQYIILSITVSHRNHNINPDFLVAVLSVLVRYTTGVFSDNVNAVTEDSPTQLWAAVALERGLTNNRLHVQGAALVRYSFTKFSFLHSLFSFQAKTYAHENRPTALLRL
jgi:hypothetical protein